MEGWRRRSPHSAAGLRRRISIPVERAGETTNGRGPCPCDEGFCCETQMGAGAYLMAPEQFRRPHRAGNGAPPRTCATRVF